MAEEGDRGAEDPCGDLVDADGQFFRTMFDKSPLPQAAIGLDATFLCINEAGCTLTGYSADELVGAGFGKVTETDSMVPAMNTFMALATGEQDWASVELVVVRKDGITLEVEVSATAVRDHDGSLRYLVASAQDLTSRRTSERLAAHRAAHDPLTELPNRAWFIERVDQALARSARQGSLIGIYFLDLDGFKDVNDARGHRVGDQVLFALAGRVGSAIRPDDTLARYGGDEFTLLCEDLPGSDEVAEIAARVLAAIDQPVRVEGGDVRLTASIGVALVSAGTCDASTAIHRADMAMYEAKSAGKARYHVVQISGRD